MTIVFSPRRPAAGLLLLAGLTATTITTAQAQTGPPYPSAAASDPLKLGWMQGFPPPPDKVLSVEDGSFLKFPALRWSVVHMRQLLPTVDVSPGLGAPAALPAALDMARIDALTFRP